MDVCTNIKGPTNRIRLLMANLPTILSDLLSNAFEAVLDIQVVNPVNDVQNLLDASKNGTADVILLGSSRVENICNTVAIIAIVQTPVEWGLSHLSDFRFLN